MQNKEYTITVGGKTVSFTPTHYESYIQIYKTPQEAVRQYARLIELTNMERNNQRMDPEQKKELSILRRKEELAKQFDAAHNYMLDKNSFSQQDINYAFETAAAQSRSDNNRNIVRSGMLQGQTSGDVYQALFLEKIFGGMKQRLKQAEKAAEIDENNIDDWTREWLDNDLTMCLNKNHKGMMMILRGMKNAADTEDNRKKPNKEDLKQAAMDMIFKNWIFKVFNTNGVEKKGARAIVMHRYIELRDNSKSSFQNKLEEMINTLLQEDKSKIPDSLQDEKLKE